MIRNRNCSGTLLHSSVKKMHFCSVSRYNVNQLQLPVERVITVWLVGKLKSLPSVWVGTCLWMGLFGGGLLQIGRAHCRMPFQRSTPLFQSAASQVSFIFSKRAWYLWHCADCAYHQSSQCYWEFYLLFCVSYFLQINIKLEDLSAICPVLLTSLCRMRLWSVKSSWRFKLSVNWGKLGGGGGDIPDSHFFQALGWCH